MTGHDAPEATLGERLEAVARVIAARHQVHSPWASRAVPVLRRTARLIESLGGRFERGEARAGPTDLPAELTGPPRWGDGSGRAFRGAVPGSAAPTGPGADAGVAGLGADAGVAGLGADAGVAGLGADAIALGADGMGLAASAVSPAVTLPADIRARLADIAGPGAGLLRVRADAAADSLSRAHRADAVTAGADVYFRAGRFQPGEPDGFALLAHEAAHVTSLLNPGLARRRAAAGGVSAEEDAALATERAARQRFGQTIPGPPLAGRPAAVHGAPPPAPRQPQGAVDEAGPSSGAAQVRPMRASVDRDNGLPPPFDVEALRRDLIADLARQLRSEFERGG
jgi:hypothetical protein